MDKVQNLRSIEAIKKLREIADNVKVCMFFTHAFQAEQGSPMTVAQVDDEGTIWFMASKMASKVKTIQSETADVHLVFSHPGKEIYLDLNGQAAINTDKNKIKELWTPLAKAWFPEGESDPSICLIAVRASKANYWDTQHGKMVEFMKIITAALTGNHEGDGVSGELEMTR